MMETESISKSLFYFSQMMRRWSRESFTEISCRDILKIYIMRQARPPLFIANMPLKYIFNISSLLLGLSRSHSLKQAAPYIKCIAYSPVVSYSDVCDDIN